ncbi:hypothetical protein D3C81_393710 [compost metagenome]
MPNDKILDGFFAVLSSMALVTLPTSAAWTKETKLKPTSIPMIFFCTIISLCFISMCVSSLAVLMRLGMQHGALFIGEQARARQEALARAVVE